MTFKQTLNRVVTRMTWTIAGLIAVFLVATVTQEDVSISHPLPAASPYSMINDCDTDVPKGVFPSKALIQRPNAGSEWVTSRKDIGKAIDDVMKVKDWHNVRVIATCK